jgi:prevent-host-death family protein
MLWKYKDAKARFEEIVALAQDGQTQLITVQGKAEVAVLSMSAFRKLFQGHGDEPGTVTNDKSVHPKTNRNE